MTTPHAATVSSVVGAPLRHGSYYQRFLESRGSASVRLESDVKVGDRAAYVSFLETQLEATAAAAMATQDVAMKLEEKVAGLTHLFHLLQQYTDRQGEEAGTAVATLHAQLADVTARLEAVEGARAPTVVSATTTAPVGRDRMSAMEARVAKVEARCDGLEAAAGRRKSEGPPAAAAAKPTVSEDVAAAVKRAERAAATAAEAQRAVAGLVKEAEAAEAGAIAATDRAQQAATAALDSSDHAARAAAAAVEAQAAAAACEGRARDAAQAVTTATAPGDGGGADVTRPARRGSGTGQPAPPRMPVATTLTTTVYMEEGHGAAVKEKEVDAVVDRVMKAVTGRITAVEHAVDMVQQEVAAVREGGGGTPLAAVDEACNRAVTSAMHEVDARVAESMDALATTVRDVRTGLLRVSDRTEEVAQAWGVWEAEFARSHAAAKAQAQAAAADREASLHAAVERDRAVMDRALRDMSHVVDGLASRLRDLEAKVAAQARAHPSTTSSPGSSPAPRPSPAQFDRSTLSYADDVGRQVAEWRAALAEIEGRMNGLSAVVERGGADHAALVRATDALVARWTTAHESITDLQAAVADIQHALATLVAGGDGRGSMTPASPRTRAASPPPPSPPLINPREVMRMLDTMVQPRLNEIAAELHRRVGEEVTAAMATEAGRHDGEPRLGLATDEPAATAAPPSPPSSLRSSSVTGGGRPGQPSPTMSPLRYTPTSPPRPSTTPSPRSATKSPSPASGWPPSKGGNGGGGGGGGGRARSASSPPLPPTASRPLSPADVDLARTLHGSGTALYGDPTHAASTPAWARGGSTVSGPLHASSLVPTPSPTTAPAGGDDTARLIGTGDADAANKLSSLAAAVTEMAAQLARFQPAAHAPGGGPHAHPPRPMPAPTATHPHSPPPSHASMRERQPIPHARLPSPPPTGHHRSPLPHHGHGHHGHGHGAGHGTHQPHHLMHTTDGEGMGVEEAGDVEGGAVQAWDDAAEPAARHHGVMAGGEVSSALAGMGWLMGGSVAPHRPGTTAIRTPQRRPHGRGLPSQPRPGGGGGGGRNLWQAHPDLMLGPGNTVVPRGRGPTPRRLSGTVASTSRSASGARRGSGAGGGEVKVSGGGVEAHRHLLSSPGRQVVYNRVGEVMYSVQTQVGPSMHEASNQQLHCARRHRHPRVPPARLGLLPDWYRQRAAELGLPASRHSHTGARLGSSAGAGRAVGEGDATSRPTVTRRGERWSTASVVNSDTHAEED